MPSLSGKLALGQAARAWRDAFTRRSARAAACALLGLVSALSQLSLSRPAAAAPDAGPAAAWTLELAHPLLHVVDGDTVSVDLDGNGRLDPPRERLRLLYVDAPELGPSPKGQDLKHGLPARDFLQALLAGQSLQIVVPAGRQYDRFGRTLALIMVGGRDASLELIRQGHGYFDTRFGFPQRYGAYAEAEGEAFSARRGVWADAPSRQRYLQRLRREGKTPQARANSWYVPGVLDASEQAVQGWQEKYVTVQGRLAELRPLRKGVLQLQLAGTGGTPLRAVAFRRTAALLNARAWHTGSKLRLEGFVQRYRGRVELKVHYGQVR